jgi:biotin transport system ATP-binding protein
MIISDLTYSYAEDPAALAGANLTIPEGSLTCIAGTNGSGKSTLLALMAGLLSPTSGNITFAGVVSPGGEAELRRLTALVLQDADLQIIGATVEEDLVLGLDGAGAAKARAIAARLDLSGLLDRPVQTLSGGQKRKLTLASALAREPRALLLDEPFSGLDFPGAQEIRAILAQNRERGVTQVISAHDLEPLVGLADQVAVLHGGCFVLTGTVTDVAPHTAAYGVKPPGSSWPELL